LYIIVVGGGKIGFHLTRSLLQNGHETLCIERDPQRCAVIAEELGSVVFRGDGCEAATLERLGTSRADILIAATGEDEDNLVACQVAKHRFHVPRTIARINDPQNKQIFHTLGVDATVNSTELILAQLEQEMPAHPLISLLTLKGTNLEVVNVEIPGDSLAVGKRLEELSIPANCTVALVYDRARGIQLASPEIVLQEEDEVVAVAPPAQEDELRRVLTSP
jgi:trk system potassium uptake protein TrkA